ncbi:hypothetical protein FGG78_03930 [Thioclava sp. BHET1]|nr:hypothetical protein FGG78_03930 [Thioclava sp. BHET1]
MMALDQLAPINRVIAAAPRYSADPALQDEWRRARRIPENAGDRHFTSPKRSHDVAREPHEDGVPRAAFSAADILLSPKEAGHDEI